MDGQLSPVARQAVERLRAADTHGLPVAAYLSPELEQALRRVRQPDETPATAPLGAPVDAATTMRRDHRPDAGPRDGVRGPVSSFPIDASAQSALAARLRQSMLRFLHDLHHGRVPPAELPPGYRAAERAPFDAPALLDAALAAGDLDAAIRAAQPALPQYEQLRVALARYRLLAGSGAWSAPLPPVTDEAGRRVPAWRPGRAWSGQERVLARLRALGDLPESPREGEDPEAWAEAVRRFQRRHGLEPDGVVGPQTRAQLEVSPERRARQIELSLERLRWTPLTGAGPRIVINVPEYLLRAYEGSGPDGTRIQLKATMRVVVGRALDTRTPLLASPMREIEFNPYWDVPESIAVKELVPSLRESPERWAEQGYEFVTRQGRVVEALGEAMLDAVLAGQARIRQRPGPRNALGAIVFRFPNTQQIYVHDTPAPALFRRDRRDLSHGCIRVEDPVALARFVLSGTAEGDDARIRAAMASGERSTLRLPQPVPVVITYVTAIARSDGLHFRPDVYGHDAALERRLARSVR